ncbi:hypothetical protein [Dysgonomonas sp. GY617]|uniref:hypothetical protein n=1 Tax=Dysgonomonas sp. GY617 TaxID=2780420 RepID=UPI001F549423|nr:hypothetical protein [Dysgonomonas sp. GY617]
MYDLQPRVVYTDCITAIDWLRNKKTASMKKNPVLKKAEVFLKAMGCEVDQIKIVYWNNDVWGEIPVDFENIIIRSVPFCEVRRR